MTASSIKQVLRKQIIAQREQLSPDVRAALSAKITARILQLPAYQQAQAVLGYMNFGTEFASELWIKQALAEGKKLALPRVNRHTMQLDLFWVDDLENQLAAGMWGIREPVVERCERVATVFEVEFALLPGVAFTRDGGRLGYGGGFYDKLLAQLQDAPSAQCPALVAAAFTMQFVPELPLEATDVRVDCLVTEQEIIDCARA